MSCRPRSTSASPCDETAIPRPRAVETAFVGVASPEAALELLGIASEATPGVTSFELISYLKFSASNVMT